MVLDYYSATLQTLSGTPNDHVDISKMSRDQVVDFFRSRVAKTAMIQDFEYALKKIGPFESWKLTNLSNIDDSNEPFLMPPNCRKVVLAIRQGQTVYLDQSYARALSPAQQGVLLTHEALFYIAETVAKQETSEHVRDLIDVMIKSKLDLTRFKDFVYAIEENFYGYEVVFSGSRLSKNNTQTRYFRCNGVEARADGFYFFLYRLSGESTDSMFGQEIRRTAASPDGEPTSVNLNFSIDRTHDGMLITSGANSIPENTLFDFSPDTKTLTITLLKRPCPRSS